MKRSALLLLAAALLPGADSSETTASFSKRFDEIKKTASKADLYRFLWALPKGGDLHNHFVQSFQADWWYAAATDPQRTKGNEYYARVRFKTCPGDEGPLVRFRTIQRATLLSLSECQKGEYDALSSFSPELRTAWISSLHLDKPGEGRNEFFEVLGTRRGDLGNDPNLLLDLMVQNLKSMSAQGLRYLETQYRPAFIDQAGKPIEEERGIQMLRDRLNSPEVRNTGVTVRFLGGVRRFAPDAEQQVEDNYRFLDQHRDLWVGMNMAGREDNDKGYPQRFMDVHRKLRRTYPGIKLAFHGGEVDSPGDDVRRTLLLGAERIGHGVNLITDPETMLFLRYNRYLVEINLISNNLLEYVPDLSKHPFPEYLRLGIPVCLNTDDPGAWDSNMTDEYFTAVTNFNLTWQETVQLGRNSLEHAFVEEPTKTRLLGDYEKAVREFESKYGGGDWTQKLQQIRPAPSGYAQRTLGVTF